MNTATITFSTELSEEELTSELETAGILAALASHFGAYPVITVIPQLETETGSVEQAKGVA